MTTSRSDFRDTPEPRTPRRALVLSLDGSCGAQLQRCLDASEGPPFYVQTLASTEQALQILREERVHALLVDLRGRDEAQRLTPVVQTREVLSRLPIIVLSERDRPEEALQALRLGAQDYLVGAFDDPPSLRRSLRHALERHRLIAELLVARHRAQFVATHDPLTQLPNRILLHDQLARSMAHAARSDSQVAALFVDLDGFKSINDTLGHHAGDELLVQVGERLAGCTRQADMVARIGGDEFVVMTQGIGRDEAPGTLAEKILTRLASPFVLGGREYWISASIGIAVFPRDATDVAQLIRNADVALYQAKGQGRNTYRFFGGAVDTAVHKRLEIESRLRKALETEELELYYQPKVETVSGRITGAEALLRWKDADLGRIPPQEFIPIAEEAGIIQSIGDWTLRKSLTQLEAWRAQGLAESLVMLVNLSGKQIDSDGLHQMVTAALWDTSLSAGDLSLEVTESAVMNNERRATEVLGELKRTGIAIALDDFGTGFSSLNYLKRFPVDTVKIDRSFVRDLAFDPDDAAIVAAILSIARQLELNVVAEGVETLEQREFLRERNCPEIQGFLYSPPLPLAAFTELLRVGQCVPEPKTESDV